MANETEKHKRSSKSKEKKSSEYERNKKKSKGKKSNDKGESKEQVEFAECVLRKIVKDKKKNKYSKDEVKKIFGSVKEPKSGFPTYKVSIYPNKVMFKPKKSGKKIGPINYKTIEQITRVPGDLNSFLLHVPKSKESKQFTGLFSWLEPESADKLEHAVKKSCNMEESEVPEKFSQKFTPNRDHSQESNRISQPTETTANENSDTDFLTAPTARTMIPRRRASHSDLGGVCRLTQTFTIYTPNTLHKQSENRKRSYDLQDSSESDYSSSSYDEYICYDKDSVFYGERMSPKSQYVDRLLRATAQSQYRAY